LIFANSIIFGNGTNFKEDDGDPQSVQTFMLNHNSGNQVVNPNIRDPYNMRAPDFRITAGSVANGSWQNPGGGFFENAGFQGAVGPDDDWTDGWTTHTAN
jgi:hypothetical protein